MNAIPSHPSLSQGYSLRQDYLSVSSNNKLSDKEFPKTHESYKQQIIEVRMEALFNTKGEVKGQTAATAAINLADFATTPPDEHLAMIKSISPEQATELVSDEGYYGIAQTAQRLADFVLMGGGEDINKLRAGREGILRGFKEAEEMWGGNLPEISYKTIDSALEQIDQQIRKLGGSILDVAA